MLRDGAGVRAGAAGKVVGVRLKLIACEILCREACAAVARSPHRVDIEFLTKGLHDAGARPMAETLQAAVDRTDAGETRYDAVCLGYALCGNGVVGLTARSTPLVLPRAHDCITLFMGSRERYLRYFNENPGVYFLTSGWIERGEGAELTQLFHDKQGFGMSYEELVAKYGEDNAQYLYEQLGKHSPHYRQFTYIEMGVEPDERFERETMRRAAEHGWKYEKVRGDLALVEGLVAGDWNGTDFLVVEPGHRVVARYDDGIIGTEAVK